MKKTGYDHHPWLIIVNHFYNCYLLHKRKSSKNRRYQYYGEQTTQSQMDSAIRHRSNGIGGVMVWQSPKS